MNWTQARRAEKMNSSMIRKILKVTEKPGIISFAGGLPSPKTFPTSSVAQIDIGIADLTGAVRAMRAEGSGPAETSARRLEELPLA